jgi:hypothetical protein
MIQSTSIRYVIIPWKIYFRPPWRTTKRRRRSPLRGDAGQVGIGSILHRCHCPELAARRTDCNFKLWDRAQMMPSRCSGSRSAAIVQAPTENGRRHVGSRIDPDNERRQGGYHEPVSQCLSSALIGSRLSGHESRRPDSDATLSDGYRHTYEGPRPANRGILARAPFSQESIGDT